MTVMDQAAFQRALQAAFKAGYEDGFSERDHSGDRTSGESWAYWLSSDEGKAVVAQPWEHLCDVSVDSARLLIIDPRYIDEYWKFSQKKSATPVSASELSFAACFQATNNLYRGGSVCAGEFARGAALVSGSGDGRYGVYILRDEEGDIAQLFIDFTRLAGASRKNR